MAASTLSGSGSAAGRRRWAVFGLTAPAYIWLALTVLLPLSAMLYFSFLTVAPIGARVPDLRPGHPVASVRYAEIGVTLDGLEPPFELAQRTTGSAVPSGSTFWS